MSYLKSEQYYNHLHDRLTVEQCHWIENFHKAYKPKESTGKYPKELRDAVLAYGHDLRLLFETGERYLRKADTIREWMERDRAKDEFFDSARAPSNIRCLKCGSLMGATFKDLWDTNGKDRVLFMFDCSRGCLPRRSFFDNGEEWKREPRQCAKCKGATEESHQRTGQRVITTSTCTRCSHQEKDELDLSSKQEVVDEDFEKDRQRFCLSEEKAQEYVKTKQWFEDVKKFVEDMKEREANKDVYDAVATLKKLTIIELQNLLIPIVDQAGYSKFELGKPDISRNVAVEFSTQDSKPGREEYDSIHQLRKLIQKTLEGTNWRLMSEGISYRLGFLGGRMRGYEREEDLLELVRAHENKLAKSMKE